HGGVRALCPALEGRHYCHTYSTVLRSPRPSAKEDPGMDRSGGRARHSGDLIAALSGRNLARNLHSDVLWDMGFAIVSGQYAEGSILPPDTELLERFRVSRTVLREALKTLAAKGLIEARARIGTRVLPRNRW